MEIGVIVTIAVFIGGIIWYLVKRRYFSTPDKKSFFPDVHVSRLVSDGSLYAEIQNVGSEAIKNLKVTINRLAGGVTDSRQAYRFFNVNENPVFCPAHSCEFLNVNEKKKISGIPQQSEDGKIQFVVEGEGVNSSKPIKKEFTINIHK